MEPEQADALIERLEGIEASSQEAAEQLMRIANILFDMMHAQHFTTTVHDARKANPND